MKQIVTRSCAWPPSNPNARTRSARHAYRPSAGTFRIEEDALEFSSPPLSLVSYRRNDYSVPISAGPLIMGPVAR
jgi:hypothetical protein